MYTFQIEVTDREKASYYGEGRSLFEAFTKVGIVLSTMNDEDFDKGIPSKFSLTYYDDLIVKHESDKMILGVFDFAKKIGASTQELPKDIETIVMLMDLLMDAEAMMAALKQMYKEEAQKKAASN